MWYPEVSLSTRACGLASRLVVSSPASNSVRHGDLMSQEDLLALLNKARTVLDRYLFDESEAMRDDVAQMCMAIDEALPGEGRAEVKKAELERLSQRSAA